MTSQSLCMMEWHMWLPPRSLQHLFALLCYQKMRFYGFGRDSSQMRKGISLDSVRPSLCWAQRGAGALRSPQNQSKPSVCDRARDRLGRGERSPSCNRCTPRSHHIRSSQPYMFAWTHVCFAPAAQHPKDTEADFHSRPFMALHHIMRVEPLASPFWHLCVRRLSLCRLLISVGEAAVASMESLHTALVTFPCCSRGACHFASRP